MPKPVADHIRRNRSHRPRVRRSAHRALTIVELLIVVVILGLMLVLALPSRAGSARAQLQVALQIIQADVYTLESMARAAPPGEIYAMIMHHPYAPVADAAAPPAQFALAFVAKGACCIKTGCADGLSESDCISAGGTYRGDGSFCVDESLSCTSSAPPTADDALSIFDSIPILSYDGTIDSPNLPPEPPPAWPGTPGGADFPPAGAPDGDPSSFYSCGVIRDADTPDETFVELTRPDGRPWNFDFAQESLDLVTLGPVKSPGFYSQTRALRFDHLGRPSRNVLFSLVADKHMLAITITTSGKVFWSLDANTSVP